ncbi:lactococcin 972 family bacteriocin [Arachnia propionica]|nr:lactococcin 972 family bacteriocin [Arachnia propionica]
MKWSLGKRVAAMVVAVGLLAGAQVGAAGAWESAGMRTQYPSAGGTWEYGYYNLYLRSYYTVNKCHGSTVSKKIHGAYEKVARSIDTRGGKKSIAEIWTLNSPGLDGQYHYRVC